MKTPRTAGAAGRVQSDPKGTIHTVCPYFTMFPLQFPLQVLAGRARTGDWVLDPFCGRGTTTFAARLLGLPSVGIDSSPVATAIAQAKLPRVDPKRVSAVASRILARAADVDVPKGEFWRLAFNSRTLRDLCRLRASLLRECESPERIVLRAVLLGILHGPRNRGVPTYLSNQAPRTYAPKPAYAVTFWRRHRLQAPGADVVDLVQRRCEHVLAQQSPSGRGRVMLGDSRAEASYPRERRFRWVVTSPPYYGLRTYLPDQWLRLWFLGGADAVDYEYPVDALRHTSEDVFASDMGAVWKRAADVCVPGAAMVVRFGAIRDRKVEPLEVLRNSLRGTGWRVRRVQDAGNAHGGKRQAEQFGLVSRRPLREVDLHARYEG